MYIYELIHVKKIADFISLSPAVLQGFPGPEKSPNGTRLKLG